MTAHAKTPTRKPGSTTQGQAHHDPDVTFLDSRGSVQVMTLTLESFKRTRALAEKQDVHHVLRQTNAPGMVA